VNELMRIALDLPPQASSVAHRIDVLHYTVITTAFVVAALSFGAIGVFLIRFRERTDRRSVRSIPRKYETAAAVFTLSVFILWWIIGFAQYRDIHTKPDGDPLRIYVVGKQWMWEFVYPNGVAAQDELRVPIGQPIEVNLTSRDVIHSFFIPAFRVKTDAVPGRINTMWFTATEPGTYEILCAEYCGAGHSRMRGRVVAMPANEYGRWLAGQVSTDLSAAGERLSAHYGCFRCHTVDGTPHLGPTWLGMYGTTVPLLGGGTAVVDGPYITESMMDPLVQIHVGYAPIMPSFLGQISGPEAAAIVEYIRSLRRPQ
jgi:cytochrome c oxidase subunit 2